VGPREHKKRSLPALIIEPDRESDRAFLFRAELGRMQFPTSAIGGLRPEVVFQKKPEL
jgi:hypothetical protein